MSIKQYTAVCPETTDKEGTLHPVMSVTVDYDFHEDEDISVLCDVFTIPVVKSAVLAKFIIALQGWCRGQLKAGRTPADITKAVADGKWKPGIAKPKMSAMDKAINLTADMPDDDFDAYLARLQEARKAAAKK